jgi:3-oxoacyl-[acyl-carrier-protein] synthase III
VNRTRYESLGIALPERVVHSDAMLAQMGFKAPKMLRGLTGIVERRFCDDDEHTLSIACQAARACLERSRYDGRDLDVVVSASISHFHTGRVSYFEPATSHHVAEALGASRALCFDVSNACAGMITGAYILDGMIRAGAARNGLVVSGECISDIAKSAMKEVETVADPQFASLTVGDAGAAFILDGQAALDEGIDFIEMMTLGEFAGLCIGRWSEQGSGARMYSNIGELGRAGAGEDFSLYILDALAKHGKKLDRSDYDHVIFHQVSVQNIKKNVGFFETRFGLELPSTLICADRFGNTASTSHAVALHEALRREEVVPGDRVLMIAQASGINLGVLSMTVGRLGV